MDPASVNETLSLVQKVIKLGKKATNLQYEEALLAAREAMFTFKENNLKLKEETQNLKAIVKKKDDFLLYKGVRWKKEDTTQDQPYCPVCYQKNLEMPLQPDDRNKKEQTWWRCPNTECKQAYNPWNYHEPMPATEWQDFGFGY